MPGRLVMAPWYIVNSVTFEICTTMNKNTLGPVIDLPCRTAPGTVSSSPPGEGAANNWHLEDIVRGLREARMDWRASTARTRELGGRELPSREVLQEVVAAMCGALFPMRL